MKTIFIVFFMDKVAPALVSLAIGSIVVIGWEIAHKKKDK